MKKQFRSIVAIFCLSMAALITTAQARIVDPIVITIPFSFYAGETELPAGEYEITSRNLPQSVLQIRSKDGKAAVLVMIQGTETQQSTPSPKLVFNQYGDKEFLAAIFEKGNSEGSTLVMTSTEKKFATDSEAGKFRITVR